jgi:hypothetical protein
MEGWSSASRSSTKWGIGLTSACIRGRRAAILAVAAVVGTVILGCRTDCTPPAGPVRPNVVLVTVDTLRADHLGCYGNPDVRTPHLDRLAAEGALFERCWAQTHVTLPSHLTILSSLPLAAHGVLRNDSRLPRPVEVLPDVFTRAGYRTAAFVSVSFLGPHGPLGPLLQKLDAYQGPRHGVTQARAEETNRSFFRWLRGTCRQPFFAWLHYYDPHLPYAPPSPFDAAYYHDDPYDPRQTSMAGVALNFFFYDLASVRHRLAERAADFRTLKRDCHLSSRGARGLVLWQDDVRACAEGPEARVDLRRRLGDLARSVRHDLPFRPGLTGWLTGVRDLRFPLARYAGEVSYVDEQVGRLRAELEALGVAARTILVVTADHGESLGEHGVYFDHFGLHEPNLRVPLIVWAPGRVAPGRHPEAVRGLDVAPTVLRLASLPVPAAMQGRDLLAPGASSEPLIAEAARGRQIMVLQGTWKLIRTLHDFQYVDAFGREADTTELYDLAADPEEAHDRLADRDDVARTLEDLLVRWTAAHQSPGGAGEAAPPPGVERALRALGYVE